MMSLALVCLLRWLIQGLTPLLLTLFSGQLVLKKNVKTLNGQSLNKRDDNLITSIIAINHVYLGTRKCALNSLCEQLWLQSVSWFLHASLVKMPAILWTCIRPLIDPFHCVTARITSTQCCPASRVNSQVDASVDRGTKKSPCYLSKWLETFRPALQETGSWVSTNSKSDLSKIRAETRTKVISFLQANKLSPREKAARTKPFWPMNMQVKNSKRKWTLKSWTVCFSVL